MIRQFSDSGSDDASISSPVTWEMPKALIVDDSPFERQMVASSLLPKKFEGVFAVDASQTFRMQLRSTAGLVLLDRNVHDGTGMEVLKRLGHSRARRPSAQRLDQTWSCCRESEFSLAVVFFYYFAVPND